MRQIALALFALCLAAVLGVLDVSVLIASSENVTQQIKNEKIIENATGINSNDANKTDKDDTLIKWYKNKLSNWERLASVLRFLQIALAGYCYFQFDLCVIKAEDAKMVPGRVSTVHCRSEYRSINGI